MLEINFWAVFVCAVVAMVIGFVWYGPLFGKKYMQAMGMVGPANPEEQKKMMQGMWKSYLIQFVLGFFQVYVLAHYIAGWKEASGLTNALWIWAAFIIPTVAGSILWNDKSTKNKWTLFFISASYQLALFVAFGLILGSWR